MTTEEEAFSESCVEVMSRIAAAVAVLTLEDADGVRRGMTITSLTSVAADPPAVLVCVANTASSRPSMVPGQTFCANLLAADQVPHSLGFSWAKSDDPFRPPMGLRSWMAPQAICCVRSSRLSSTTAAR